VRPSGSILHTTQHRLREKTFLSGAGFPLTPFLPVRSIEDLLHGLERLGRPAVLKTADFGYDGKGQALIGLTDDAAAAWRSIGSVEAVLEAFVDFERELSVVAARGIDGSFAHYGAIDNAHCNRILDVSVAPACVPREVADEAVEIARGVLEQLDVVGVLCVEFFLTRAGKLLINELAPRPHNSGHLTFDACITSQFEQQLRAVCGLAAFVWQAHTQTWAKDGTHHGAWPFARGGGEYRADSKGCQHGVRPWCYHAFRGGAEDR
jgi:5-(carboxyamino)imidazole ribonucleotide synthase